MLADVERKEIEDILELVELTVHFLKENPSFSGRVLLTAPWIRGGVQFSSLLWTKERER